MTSGSDSCRTEAMQVDLTVPSFAWQGGTKAIAPTLTDVARTAEEIGVRAFSLMDHWFQIEMVGPKTDPMLEGYTGLGFVAAVTERMRLRLLVTGVTYRHPGLLAKTVTTLDVLSGGRAELGIGAAWAEDEHRGLGVPFPPVAERFERLEETLQICLQMWSDDDGPYKGTHYQLAETLCVPQPISQPRVPILIGGNGEKKTLRLTAQYADAWHTFAPPEVMGPKIEILRRHCDDVGRDFQEIQLTSGLLRVSPSDPDTVLRMAEEYTALGVETVVITIDPANPIGDLESWAPLIAQLAELGGA